MSTLAKIPDGKAKTDGIALGQEVADQIISWRSTDGADKTVTYTGKTDPGSWIPTPPAFATPLLPQWPDVTPFAMTSASQFRPPAPPALDSAKYAEEVNFVKEIGKIDSLTRTPDLACDRQILGQRRRDVYSPRPLEPNRPRSIGPRRHIFGR